MRGGCTPDFLAIEMCSLLGNSIQFLLKYKTPECACLHCTVCAHQLFLLVCFWWGFFVCLFFGFFDCLKVEMSFV